MAEPEQEMTLQEQQMIEAALRKMETEDKPSKHNFLTTVLNNPSTLRTGNLTAEEVGILKLPVRTIKECELMSRSLVGDDVWASYFEKEAEIMTGTSLSKEGFFMNLAALEKRELSDKTNRRKPSSSWFKKKEPAATT